MTEAQVKIIFHGGAESVTGSNFLLAKTGTRPNWFLIDCGLFQGSKVCDDENRKPFAYDVKSIDALFVTHAHLDHIGRIPKLVRDGFTGPIYSTAPTKEMAELSLVDSLGVMTKESKRDGSEVFYSLEDVKQAISKWQTVDYHEPIKIDDFTIVFRDAGHILGSAMVEFQFEGRKIVFTGDLGNSPAPLLQPTEKLTDTNYLIMESVYGDRNHEQREFRAEKLEKIIEQTMARKGTLMIPAFSIERTQEILYEIENLMEASRIPLVPVFLDSPLAIGITKIYKKYDRYFNHEVKYIIATGDGIFKFPQLQMTKTTDESKAIANFSQRKIIIAGSGMSNGGRIIHHEKNYIPDPQNTLLLVGYQPFGCLGRILQDGAPEVKILGQTVPVRAQIETISGYSAHKDSDGLLDFVADTADSLEKVFVTMGEPKASLFLVQRIRENLEVSAESPEPGEEKILFSLEEK